MPGCSPYLLLLAAILDGWLSAIPSLAGGHLGWLVVRHSLSRWRPSCPIADPVFQTNAPTCHQPPPAPLTPCFPPQVGSGEVWSPVCLPAFNPDGYFYAYAAALDEDQCGGSVTLILLLTQREAFYAAAACRRRLEAELRAQGWMEEFGAAIKGGYTAYGASQPGAPELRHFLYKPLEGDEEVLQVPQFTW